MQQVLCVPDHLFQHQCKQQQQQLLDLAVGMLVQVGLAVLHVYLI